MCVKEERRFLLKKLIEHDSELLSEAKPFGSTISENGHTKKSIKKRSSSDASNKRRNSTNSKSTAKKSAKKKQIQTITVDAFGHPIFPIHFGANLSVFDLGNIITDRPGYHNENWIYPVGYVSTRIYGHIKEPGKRCTYTCKITDAGEYPRCVV